MKPKFLYYVFLIVLLFLPIIHPVFATTIFSDGFESGNFNAWTGTEQSGGTIVVSSAYAHHGSYSAKASITASQGYASCYKDITSQTTIYIRAYVYIAAGTFASGVQVGFISPRDVPDSITACHVGVANANRQLWLQYRHSTTNYDVYSSTTLSTNTWYCIELKYVKSTTAGEYRVWLNGNEVTDLTQTGKNTDADVTRVRVGPRFTNVINNFVGYFDCVVVANTYIGPEAAGQTYNFYGSASLTYTVNTLKTYAFNRQGTSIITLGIDYLRTVVFQRQSIATLTFGVNFEKAFTLTKTAIASLTFLTTSEKLVSLTRYGTSALAFTIESLANFVSAKTLNLFGSATLNFLVNTLRTVSFNRFGTSTLTFTIESIASFVSAKTLSFFGTAQLQFTTNILKQFTFNRYGTSTLTFTIESLYRKIQTLNFFGTATLNFLTNTLKAMAFNRYATAPLTFTIETFTQGLGTWLNLFGSASFAFNIQHYITTTMPPIDYGIIALGFAVVAFAVAATAIATKKD
jgi:hypothetical protein